MTLLITKNNNKTKLSQIRKYAKELGVELDTYDSIEDYEAKEDEALLKLMDKSRTHEYVEMDIIKNMLRN